MPKHNLATISKLEYFGHIMQSSDSMKKDLILRLKDGSGKTRKTVYKKISRNMRNHEDKVVQHLNCHTKVQLRDLIYKT
jgi:oligoendopeptidase F